MLFNLLVLFLFAAIVYYHYVQGFVTSIISMVLAILAGVISVSHHEWLVSQLLGGRAAEYAHAIALTVIFALVYGLGRVAFDKLAPGNVQAPVLMDRIGAVLCGSIAAAFAVGNFALSVQALPFDAEILLFDRYERNTRDAVVAVPGRRNVDGFVVETKNDPPTPEDQLGLWLPVDEWLVGFASSQSESGALGRGNAMPNTHPDLVMQFYHQRLGIEVGAKRTALNIAGHTQVAVDELNVVEGVNQIDDEQEGTRNRRLPAELRAATNETLLIVRTRVKRDAADRDGVFRFSPASVRLVAGRVNHHPVGVLERNRLLVANRFDDALFVVVDDEAVFDLVFKVPRDAVLVSNGQGGAQIAPGVFFEAKRLARVTLGGRDVVAGVDTDAEGASPVLRKEGVRIAIARYFGDPVPGN
jgi:hypothetical protein